MLLAPACASRPTTSRLTADDFVEMTESMAAALRGSDLVGERTAEDPPMRIALMPALNLSSDLVAEGERWIVSERIRDSAELRALADQKNVVWLMPIEDVRRLRGQSEEMLLAAVEREPTHVLRPVLRSLTRRANEARTDVYVVSTTIEDLATGEAVWSADFLVKRSAFGKAWD